MKKATKEDFRDVHYFITEKGDVNRLSSWEVIKDSVFDQEPHLKVALDKLKEAEDYLELVLDKINNKY